ncbi:MAG: thioredoxin family protein, partial [Verrucomicrobiota bacterium]
MAVSSTMLPLGTVASAFSLSNTIDGKIITLDDFSGAKAYAIFFLCNHCPYVVHLQNGLVSFARDYQPKGVAVIAISSNDILSYPEDGPDLMKKTAEEAGYPFPYLFDESQEVAKAYHAACTPDLFLFDGNRKLVYRGQFDESRKGNTLPVTGSSFRNACDLVLSGKSVPAQQIPSIGCNIKWKSGNEPEYF